MKTKHILTAMALPALFAACTADDIVSENNGLQQDQRAKLSKDFVLNVNNEVESRYAVEEGATGLDFIFAEGDKIGANIIDNFAPGDGYTYSGVNAWDKKDPATWEIVNTVAPALPFIYEGGVWKSANEELGIGNYLFTNPFNPADKNRAAASYELPIVVQYSSENPNAHIEAYNKAVAAQITYEGQTSANADLKNIFAYPMIRINFDKNLDAKKVTKVVLARNYYAEDPADKKVKLYKGTPFIYKGAFNHKAVAKMFNPAELEVYLKDNKKNTEATYWAQFQTSDFVIDEKDDDNKSDKGTWVTLQDAIEGASYYADIKTTEYFIYEMDETVVANSIDVRFMIPSIKDLSSVPNEEKIIMYVCTDKGNFEMELTKLSNYQFSETTLAALKNAAMQRNTSYTLRTKAGALVDSPNASIFFNNVVSTAADWNKLVEEYGDLKKYSVEYKKDHLNKGDGDAAELIVNIINDKFALTSDLKMPEVAEFIIKTDVNVEGEVTLKNIKVDGGNLIVKDGAVLTTDPTLNAPSVEIEKGGELVFAAEYNKDEELVAYDAITSVHNHGTVTVPAGVIADFGLVNVDKDAVLNVGTAASRTAAEAKAILSGENYGIINNYGVIEIDAAFTNNAPVTKVGNEETGYEWNVEDKEWNAVPTINNVGTFNSKKTTTNNGLFVNSGKLSSNFVGSALFYNTTKTNQGVDEKNNSKTYTATLDVKAGAETYIDANSDKDGANQGLIILAELKPAKEFTIYKGRKDEAFAPSTTSDYKYRGVIKHTLAEKPAAALELKESPVNYLVANTDIEIANTYTYTTGSGTTAQTIVCALEKLEVTNGIVKLAAKTGAGTATSPYVYPAKVAKLIVNGEVEIDGEYEELSNGLAIAAVQVNADSQFGIPADALLEIALADIETLSGTNAEGKVLPVGKVSVVGTLKLNQVHSGNAVGETTWPKGSDGEYTAEDFSGKNIEINKDAEVRCEANTAATPTPGTGHENFEVKGIQALFDVSNMDWYKNKAADATYSIIVDGGDLIMDKEFNSATSGDAVMKTNADYASVLTGAKEVILRGGNITGLKKGSAVTAIKRLKVEGKYGISGSKNVDILKVDALDVPAGSMLKITDGYLVVNETAVIGRGNENINIEGGYTGMLIAYTSDDVIVRWDLVNSVWAKSEGFTVNYSDATVNASTATDLAWAVENGVGEVTLTDAVILTEALSFEAPTEAASYSRSEELYKVTLNLNGKKLSNDKGDVIVVKSGVELTITGDGEVYGAESNNASSCAVWADGGKVIIENGTFKVGGDNDERNDCIYAKNGGNILIKGGEFEYTGNVTEKKQNGNADGNKYLLNLKDDTEANGVAGDNNVIVVAGGKFWRFNPAAHTTEPAVTGKTSYLQLDPAVYSYATQKLENGWGPEHKSTNAYEYSWGECYFTVK